MVQDIILTNLKYSIFYYRNTDKWHIIYYYPGSYLKFSRMMTNLINMHLKDPLNALSSCYVNNVKSNKDSLNSVGKLDVLETAVFR